MDGEDNGKPYEQMDDLALLFHVCQGLNSHYFHIIGDGKNQPNSVGVYIPIIRIPIKGGMTIPNIATFDHGTCRYEIYVAYGSMGYEKLQGSGRP